MHVPDGPARSRFAALLAAPAIPLAEAALAVAEEEYPGLDAGRYVAMLDALGERVAARLPEKRSAATTLRALKAVLFEEATFRGNDAEYYDPRNSYLNEVLDRKLGIPITLSIIYIEVAARVGLAVQGVGFPGHFLVKYVSPNGELFIDPFKGGEVLSADDCRARFRTSSHGKEMDPRLLEAVGPRQILARLLHNLKKIYVEQSDDVRAFWVIDRLLLLAPESLEERRDRGLVSARLGATAAAVKDLEAYLEGAEGAADSVDVRALLSDLRGRPSLLN